jgi:transposase InsO family protein
MNDEQLEDLKQFYTTFDLKKVKNKKNVLNEIMYQLFKRPYKSKLQPRILPIEKNHTHQADILYLPNDNGFKYGLTICDVGSRLTDCEPIKDKNTNTVLEALLKIYKRNILSEPKQMQVDSGTEFKGEFQKYFNNKKIPLRVSEPNRSRQQALVESRNGSIAKPLMRRMLAQEILTDKPSNEWVAYLSTVITFLNERFENKIPFKENFNYIGDKYNSDIIPLNTQVRYLLDKPRDYLTNKKLIGNFRHGDIKWSKPTLITETIIQPQQVPLYMVKGRRNAFSKDQLQVIEKFNLPPVFKNSAIQKIEKILDKKETRNTIRYLVKYKDIEKPVYIDESVLRKEAPKLLKEFNII